MSTIIFNNVQLGQDADTTKNYTINNRDNGNLYISQGNSGVTTQDLVTFDTDGDATFLGNVTAENFIGNVIGDITGNITGNVFGNLIGTATQLLTGTASDNNLYYPTFTGSNDTYDIGLGLTFNPNTNVLSTTTFKGNLTGFASNVITNANLTGDVSSVGNATTLATVNGNVGTFGSNIAIPVVTINAKGLTTAISTVAVAIPSANITLIGDVTGTGTTGANLTTTLATVNSNVGTFGDSTHIPQYTVNNKGLITASANIAIGTLNQNTTGSANNASYLGGVPAANYVTTTTLNNGTLAANVTSLTTTGNITTTGNVTGTHYGSAANLTSFPTFNQNPTGSANNASYLGGVPAANYLVSGGALGTPSSGVATNLTGTATGLTAGNVTHIGNLTGDVTSIDLATTLATVNSNTGQFGNAFYIPQYTVNGKGLITASANIAIPAQVYPGAGVPLSTGSAWSTSYGTVGSGSVVLGTNQYMVQTGGDVTSNIAVGGSGAATLATVNTNTGQWGDATHVSQITVNGKGLITAASNVSIPNTVQISGDATSTGGTTSANAIMTLNTVNSNTGQFGDSTHVAQVTVNGKGLITAASNVAVTLSGLGYSTTGTGTTLVLNTAPSISGTITGNIAGAITALSISANAVAVNMGLNNNFSLTLQATNSQVLSNPTNVTAGQSGSIVITQNATPSTLTFGSNWTAVGGSVISSVANSVSLLTYYAASTTNIQYGISIPGSYNYIPQVSKSANYTTVLSDAGCHIYHPTADATPRTFTIDSNANVAYIIGTALTFVNGYNAGNLTIGINSDTLYFSGNGATGSRTLANTSIATALKLTSTVWQISGAGLA